MKRKWGLSALSHTKAHCFIVDSTAKAKSRQSSIFLLLTYIQCKQDSKYANGGRKELHFFLLQLLGIVENRGSNCTQVRGLTYITFFFCVLKFVFYLQFLWFLFCKKRKDLFCVSQLFLALLSVMCSVMKTSGNFCM